MNCLHCIESRTLLRFSTCQPEERRSVSLTYSHRVLGETYTYAFISNQILFTCLESTCFRKDKINLAILCEEEVYAGLTIWPEGIILVRRRPLIPSQLLVINPTTDTYSSKGGGFK